MEMGYEKEHHEKDVHGGKSVEWRKVEMMNLFYGVKYGYHI
jgi:hypothetical protein